MITAQDIVDAQHRDIEQAQRLLTERAKKTTDDALVRIDRQLFKARRGSWGEAEALATRAQLRAGVLSLALAHQQDLRFGLPPVMRAAQGRTAEYLRVLDEKFHGAVRPLRFDTLAWWEKHSAELGQVRLREFGRSFQRYGAEAVLQIEQAISSAVLTGQRWDVARREVWKATAQVVGQAQWKVDRILVTETSAAYNGTTLAALLEEDDPAAPMLKKLVATFDQRTAWDSVALHGQVRRVSEPFKDPKGRLYMAPPNRPHDREIVIGWRASWGESLPDFDRHTTAGDARFVATPDLPAAPPLRVPPGQVARSRKSDLRPEKVLLQAGIGSAAERAPRPSPQRAMLAGLTAQRLLLAAQIRSLITMPKIGPELGLGPSALDPMAMQLEQAKAEYRDLRIRQAAAATSVLLAEGDGVPLERVKPGAFLDFGGMVFRVLAVDARGIRIRTPYGPAMLPPAPVPATLRRVRPDRVVRPRSIDDVTALLSVARAARQGA